MSSATNDTDEIKRDIIAHAILPKRLCSKSSSAAAAAAAAAGAVGKSVASAYRLRKRPGAQSFAAAWDRELAAARQRALEAAMNRIFAPMARPSRYRGNFTGRITVGNDDRMILAALRAFDLSRHGFGKVEK